MRSLVGRWRTQPEGNERGAALVELALVLGFLLLLMTGIYEIGTAWNTSQGVTQASRDGARTGSQLGSRAESDFEILKAIEATLGDDMGLVRRVVIYDADVVGDMPTECENASPGYSGGANCNVYGPDHFAALAIPAGPGWGSDTTCGANDSNWCAAVERNDGPIVADLTNLGVQVELDKSSVTQLFGTAPISIKDSTVMQVALIS